MRLPVMPVFVLCVAGLSANTAVADGETIYNSGCVACHGAGIAGAPRVGDKVAWANRIAEDGLRRPWHSISSSTLGPTASRTA